MEVREENQAAVVIATASVCLALATIMVTVRLYTRFFLVRQVGLDDWLAAVTLVRGVEGECYPRITNRDVSRC